MKRHLYISCHLLTALTVVSAVYLLISSSTPRRITAPLNAEEVEENPEARAQWEWMQLHDPATGQIPRGIHHAEMAYARTLPVKRSSTLAKPDNASGGPDYIWTQRGPYNVGGRTRVLALDVTDTNTIVAGGVTGGMWRSTDKGTSWTRATTLSQLPSATCIAQDTRPDKTNTWYYGTGEFRTNSRRFGNVVYPGDGIFKSTDDGRSWNALPSTVSATPQLLDQPFDYVNNIVINPTNLTQDELYAAAYGAIMRCTDGGASWKGVLGGKDNQVGFTTVAITTSGVLYAAMGHGGTTEGVFRSKDGVTWTDITPSGWSDSCRRIVIGIAPSNEDVVYFAAETPGQGLQVVGSYGFEEYYSFWKYTYRSGDGSGSGGSWEDRSNNMPHLGQAWDFNSLNSYAFVLKVHPHDENIVFLGGTSLYRSTNGFATDAQTEWMGGYRQNYDYGYPAALHPDQHALLFDPNDPNVLYASNDGGIYMTTDGGFAAPPWKSLNNGFINGQCFTVAIDPMTDGSDILMTGMQDNGTYVTSSINPTEAWRSDFGGDGAFCAVAGGGRVRYLSSQFGNLYRQQIDDQGMPTSYAIVRPASAGVSLFINPFALDPSDDNVMYFAGGTALWRNTDLTAILDSNSNPTDINWSTIGQSPSDSAVTAIGVSKENPQHRVYYGTADGHLFRIDDAHTGTPSSLEITGANFPAGAYINCVAVDPIDGNKALVVFTNYSVQSLFYTSDGGVTWKAVGGNLEQHPDGTGNGPSCRWASIARYGNRTVFFVGTSIGLYSTVSLDGASTIWQQEGAETIGNVRVDMIQSRQVDGLIAVATWGRGIFTTNLTTSDVAEQSNATTSTLLMQSYPDPVRTMATIRFTVPASGLAASTTVHLEVFDAIGRKVVTLVDDKLPSGEHTATLDLATIPPSQMPTGTYYYRLQCGDAVETRKMIVLR